MDDGYFVDLFFPRTTQYRYISIFQCRDANGKMSKVGAILLSACTARLARSAKRVVVEFRGSLISYWVGPYGVFFCWLTALSPFRQPDDYFDRATVFLFSFLSVVIFLNLRVITKNQHYTPTYLYLDARWFKIRWKWNISKIWCFLWRSCIFIVLFSNRMKKGKRKLLL